MHHIFVKFKREIIILFLLKIIGILLGLKGKLLLASVTREEAETKPVHTHLRI